MELTVTNRSRAYPGRSSGDSKVDEVQYVVLKVCYLCTSGSVVEYRLAKARVAGSNPVSCSQRDRKKSHPMDGSFFYVRALPGSNGSNVCVPLRSSQQFQMLVKRRIAWYDKICSEMLAECISRNCRQYTIEFMHEGHTLKKV